MKGKSWIVSLLLIQVLISCSEKETVVNLPPVSDFNIIDSINKFTLDGSVSADPEGHTLTYSWSTTSGKITITNPTAAAATFNIPAGNSTFDADIVLAVSDGKNTVTATKTVSVPPLSEVRAYGIGKNLQKEVSNNQTYDWYMDQGGTGPSSLVNCGPTSVTMSLKWNSESYSGTPKDARNRYPENGGWWYTNDIVNFLNIYVVPNEIVALTSMDVLKNEIDHGNIVILCLDMSFVEYQTDIGYHVGKFYQTENAGWGHFIVAKGYKEVDDHTFFEIYDPYSFGRHYDDNALLGRDRYYKSENLDKATNIWWDYAIVVSGGNDSGGRHSVDPDKIVHMPGR